ncbi:DUF6705 domain-containing protein [Flavobacterium antarcticum]|uniref:DUF6705 family protein n=1 Tax=Flavobacterium antarcticum TaxID=271155 RepID=UPI0003B766EF|nr:DUF6705 family protein [Flavobacterium antarcticum]
MKNILFVLLLCNTLFAQSQVVNIEGWDGTRIDGVYYKDVNNHLNQFEGTYKYTEGNTEITMVFKKIINYYDGVYYEDLLIGEVKFVKDGLILFNNLSKINTVYPNQFSHHIVGNTILEPTNRPVCVGCTANQKRVDLIFFGRENNMGGSIILQKITQGNQPDKLKIDIMYLGSIWLPGEPKPLDALIKNGEYLLIKQ